MGRMQEEWLRTHDNDDAVVTGVAHTARTITAAAAIMAAVFGCFLVADVLELKEFGFALAVRGPGRHADRLLWCRRS